jgi:hypothetical protein
VERRLGKKRPDIEVDDDERQQHTDTGRRMQEANPKCLKTTKHLKSKKKKKH